MCCRLSCLGRGRPRSLTKFCFVIVKLSIVDENCWSSTARPRKKDFHRASILFVTSAIETCLSDRGLWPIVFRNHLIAVRAKGLNADANHPHV